MTLVQYMPKNVNESRVWGHEYGCMPYPKQPEHCPKLTHLHSVFFTGNYTNPYQQRIARRIWLFAGSALGYANDGMKGMSFPTQTWNLIMSYFILDYVDCP
jgi:hypothetical protein